MGKTVVCSTESVDTSANLLSESIDASFTKTINENTKVKSNEAEKLWGADVKVIFYGAVNLPPWLKFDKDRMFNNPEASRQLIARSRTLQALEKKGFNTIKYYKVNKEVSYNALAERLGKKFDVVTKGGMQVVNTVSNSKEYNAVRNQVHFACQRIQKKTKRYRLFLGLPSLCPVVGAAFSEYRTLSFKEAMLMGSNEDAAAHLENLFEGGLLNEDMGVGFDAWTEESHVNAKTIQEDANIKVFNKLSDTMHSLFGTDFCAVDVVQSGKKIIITNVTASPSLQSDEVLSFVACYFTELLETGRKFTADHIKKLSEQLDEEALQNLGKLLKAALAG